MSEQIESAANLMARDYLILAFLVSLGSLQISVSISRIRGLWIIPNRILTRVLGIALIIFGIGLYILSPLWVEGPWAAGSVTDGTSIDRDWGTADLGELSAARNLNDIHGGMAGTAYAVYFIFSAVLATIFAAAIATINNRLFPNPRVSPARGGNVRQDKGGPTRDEGNVRYRDKVSEATTLETLGPTDGLDALKHSDAISTLSTSLRNLRRTGIDDARQHMRSAHRWSIPSMIERMWRN